LDNPETKAMLEKKNTKRGQAKQKPHTENENDEQQGPYLKRRSKTRCSRKKTVPVSYKLLY
jgi:hypothetical protein